MSLAKRVVLLIALAILGSLGNASATIITSTGDPLLNGALIIDFSEVAIGTADPTIAGVSFGGEGVPVTTLNLALSGQTSPILGNQLANFTGVPFDITFSTLVSAMSIDVAAVSSPASMEAFDINGISLGTANIGDVGTTASTFGLGGFSTGIERVRISTGDFFFTDNLRYVPAPAAVPEPSTLLLLGSGLGLLGFRTWRKK